MDFKNKNIIVTGGNSGLGNATCKLIEELGVIVSVQILEKSLKPQKTPLSVMLHLKKKLKT